MDKIERLSRSVDNGQYDEKDWFTRSSGEILIPTLKQNQKSLLNISNVYNKENTPGSKKFTSK